MKAQKYTEPAATTPVSMPRMLSQTDVAAAAITTADSHDTMTVRCAHQQIGHPRESKGAPCRSVALRRVARQHKI